MYESRDIQDRMTPGAARALFETLAVSTTSLHPRPVDKPLALYGAGNLGRMARAYFDFFGIPVDFVVDINAERRREEPFWSDIRLFTPDAVPVELRRTVLLAVCVTALPLAPLARQLTEAGWTDLVPFYDISEAYRSRHPLSNGWFAAPFTAEDRQNVTAVLDGWADDASRAHHLQLLAWRRLRQEWSFTEAPIHDDDRYFIPQVISGLGKSPKILDVGAHHGEVARRCFDLYPGLDRLWMIEPDAASRNHIEHWVSTLAPQRAAKVDLCACAVGSSSGMRPFSDGFGYVSQFAENGNRLMETTTIDRLGVDPDYIKLHLEGWELDALRGATETLKRDRPIIAATLCHNTLGIWEMPLWLMTLSKEAALEYAFHLRLHNWCGSVGVMYGIPKRAIS